jgi:hypothetical protein
MTAPNDDSPEIRTEATALDRAEREAAGREASWLDADGRERPRFLKAFPEDETLAPLVAAFEAGDYAYVRENAAKVAEAATDERVKRAALELKSRIQPDPLVKGLFAVAVLLFVFLAVWAYRAQP